MIKLYEAKITDFTQADYTKMYSLLECAIRDKIDAKKSNKSKQQTLVGYILLYRAIEELYPDKDIKITYNENGKPECDFCYFNISHSDMQVVCAVSDYPIGVDIQKIKDIVPRKKYKFFIEKENDYVNQNYDFCSERFVEIFAKKEAAIKMLGKTMAHAVNIDTFSKDFCFKIQKKQNFILCVCCENNTRD